jgi:hypothetical protein
MVNKFREFAEMELLALGYSDEVQNPVQAKIRRDILALVDLFETQGHDQNSGPVISGMFQKLVNFQILCPVTNFPKDWVMMDESNNVYQHTRLYGLMKNGENGKPYYLNAIVWIEDDNRKHIGWASGTRSRQYVKSFPFMPRPFFIRVIPRQVSDEKWDLDIANQDDLKKVWEFYDFYDPNHDVLEKIAKEASGDLDDEPIENFD